MKKLAVIGLLIYTASSSYHGYTSTGAEAMFHSFIPPKTMSRTCFLALLGMLHDSKSAQQRGRKLDKAWWRLEHMNQQSAKFYNHIEAFRWTKGWSRQRHDWGFGTTSRSNCEMGVQVTHNLWKTASSWEKRLEEKKFVGWQKMAFCIFNGRINEQWTWWAPLWTLNMSTIPIANKHTLKARSKIRREMVKNICEKAKASRRLRRWNAWCRQVRPNDRII